LCQFVIHKIGWFTGYGFLNWPLTKQSKSVDGSPDITRGRPEQYRDWILAKEYNWFWRSL